MPGFKLYDDKRTVMLPVDSEQQNLPGDNRLHFTIIADPGFHSRIPRFKTISVTRSELPRAPKSTPNNASALPNFSPMLPLGPASVRQTAVAQMRQRLGCDGCPCAAYWGDNKSKVAGKNAKQNPEPSKLLGRI